MAGRVAAPGEEVRHDANACAQAWQTLRMAHERVSRRLGEELDRACALSLSEFDVLLFLRTHRKESVRLSALLDAVSLSQPALSRLVSRLERRGLVERSGTAGDRRAVAIGLTEPGAALVDQAIAIQARVVHETLTGKFSPAEQAALLQTLSRIGT